MGKTWRTSEAFHQNRALLVASAVVSGVWNRRGSVTMWMNSANFILGLTVESLNGVRNRSTASGAVREVAPEFVRALDLLREVQVAGGFGMGVEEAKLKGSTRVVFFRPDDVPDDIAARQSLTVSPSLDQTPNVPRSTFHVPRSTLPE